MESIKIFLFAALITGLIVALVLIPTWVMERIQFLKKLNMAGWDESSSGRIIPLQSDSKNVEFVRWLTQRSQTQTSGISSITMAYALFPGLFYRMQMQKRRYRWEQIAILSTLRDDLRPIAEISRELSQKFG